MNMGQTAKAHHHFQMKPPYVLVLTPMILIRLLTLCILKISFNNILKHKLLSPSGVYPSVVRLYCKHFPSSLRVTNRLIT